MKKNLDGRKMLGKVDHKYVEEALLKWFSIQEAAILR